MTAPHILADTCIWIDHIGKGNPELAELLRLRRIVLHPMIVGEVALGSLARRSSVLEDLSALPQAKVVIHAEVMAMIEWLKLFSCGIGYVDAHLLAATRQLSGARIWTRDNKLRKQAERLGIAYTP